MTFHVAGILMGVAAGLVSSNSEPADLILLNGNVYTLDPDRPRAEAVAVRGERIIYVGSSREARAFEGPSTRVLDLGGATVVPGLTDAHAHVSSLGFSLERLKLHGTTSASQIAEMVRRKAATLEPGTWIRGRGWDQNDWEEKGFPTREILDAAAPEHPVVLDRVDGHAIWANTRAMRQAGVTNGTSDPPGGRIVRAAGGEPTGVFIDAASGLIESRIPPPSSVQIRDALKNGMRRCLEAGLTGVHDAGVSALELDLYREILVRDAFPFRIYAMLTDDPHLIEERLSAPPQIGLGSHRLTVRALKLYADGALGSRGAALLKPYSDDPQNSGLIRLESARLRRLAERAAAAGFQICTHAIGDGGNRLVLDALESALGPAVGTHRFRIEHAQVLAPEDIPRFGSLGVIASMQPTHATSDMYWAGDRLGPERVRGAYAWQDLLRAGARLACGSDFPVESEKPLLGFYAAVTRQDAGKWPEGGWHPDQRLSREQALRCFTLDAAYAAFEEDLRGSVTIGKLADLTVLSRDIMRIPALEILDTEVRATVVGGVVAFEKK